jgi:hypothetical protein
MGRRWVHLAIEDLPMLSGIFNGMMHAATFTNHFAVIERAA